MTESRKNNTMRVECPVCFRRCALTEGQTGACGARKNVEGRIVPVNYAMSLS